MLHQRVLLTHRRPFVVRNRVTEGLHVVVLGHQAFEAILQFVGEAFVGGVHVAEHVSPPVAGT